MHSIVCRGLASVCVRTSAGVSGLGAVSVRIQMPLNKEMPGQSAKPYMHRCGRRCTRHRFKFNCAADRHSLRSVLKLNRFYWHIVCLRTLFFRSLSAPLIVHVDARAAANSDTDDASSKLDRLMSSRCVTHFGSRIAFIGILIGAQAPEKPTQIN